MRVNYRGGHTSIVTYSLLFVCLCIYLVQNSEGPFWVIFYFLFYFLILWLVGEWNDKNKIFFYFCSPQKTKRASLHRSSGNVGVGRGVWDIVEKIPHPTNPHTTSANVYIYVEDCF